VQAALPPEEVRAFTQLEVARSILAHAGEAAAGHHCRRHRGALDIERTNRFAEKARALADMMRKARATVSVLRSGIAPAMGAWWLWCRRRQFRVLAA
jgi:hypothetical protein